MPDGEDWIMAPVLAGLISYTDLLDGSLSLVDISRMVDAITVKGINQRRYEEAMRGNS